MGYQKIVILALLFCLTACTTITESLEETIWEMRKGMREPGEKLLASSKEVWLQYSCDSQPVPFIKIEINELVPSRLDPGEEFNHRLVYGLCSDTPSGEINGLLYTRIYFEDKVIVDDRQDNLAVKPGRWRIDTFVALPPHADSGSYAIEVEFVGNKFRNRRLRFIERKSFMVR